MSRAIALLLAGGLAGCASHDPAPEPERPPPLTITGISPTTAEYGAEIVITGTHFGDIHNNILDMPLLQFPGLQFSTYPTRWSDTEIRVRVPFPATPGPITVEIPRGNRQVRGPMFTPIATWTPGAGAVSLYPLVEPRVFGGTGVVLGFTYPKNEPVATVFTGATTTSYELTGVRGGIDRRDPLRAHLIADATGMPEVIASTLADELIVIPLAGDHAVAIDTGIFGVLVAAGRDATGPYAWVSDDRGLSRVRPGPASDGLWHADRGPFNIVGADIAGADGMVGAAVADDGTLVIGYGIPTGNIFDNTAQVAINTLLPGDTAFHRHDTPDGRDYDDYIASAQILVSGDGKRVLARFSTQENDEFNDHPLASYVRESDGTWHVADVVSDTLGGGAPTVATAASFATFGADSLDGGLSPTITPDILATPLAPRTLPLYPAEIDALAVDGDQLRPFVRTDGKLWFPTPPADPR